jgi:hypothetical protein
MKIGTQDKYMSTDGTFNMRAACVVRIVCRGVVWQHELCRPHHW